MEGYHPPTDPHSHVLHGGRFSNVPGGAVHIADQMEAGGAKIEEALARINCKYQTLFFCSSWGVVLASGLAMGNSIVTLQIANFITAVFMGVFGCMMVMLDIPGSPRWAAKHRYAIRKHARFLTRLTGKSVWFIYLSSMIALTLWPSDRNTSYGALLFTALGTSCFVAFVAGIGLFIAMRKTLRLERIRKSCNNHFRGNGAELYRKYAITDPIHGIQFEEFNRLASDYSQGTLTFDLVDLAIIYNALDDHQKSSINEREFTEWLGNSMTLL